MYIGTALYILRLRYVYRQRTLYSAIAICISALHFIYCNCDMYIGTALYIVQLRYVHRHRTLYIGTALYIVQLRYVYRQRTLYSATAICISAPHFIYCDCVIYICTALGHSHEVRGATPSHYEVRTFYGVPRGQMSHNDQDESTSIGRPRARLRASIHRIDPYRSFGLAAPRRTFEPHNEKAWLLVPRGCVLVRCRYIYRSCTI